MWVLCLSGASLVAASTIALWSPGAFGALIELAAAIKQTSVREEWPSRLGPILHELVSLGLVLLAAGAALAFPRQFAGALAKRHLRVGAAVTVLMLVQGISAWFRKSAVVDGQRIWFLDDDAMISMRYASNLADGHGLVWNVGERVEGYSNFLWTCIMAAVHWIGVGPEAASAVILFANIALTCALLIVLDLLCANLSVPPLLTAATLILGALARAVLVWSLSGLETVALAALCTWVLARLARAPQGHHDICTYIALALLPLVRADAVVLAVLIAAASFAMHRDLRKTAKLAATAILPFVIHVVVRHQYYGEWLPNTAYLKVGGWEDRVRQGMLYDWRFFSHHGAAAVLMAVAVVRAQKRRFVAPLAGFVAAYSVYVCYLGGDAFSDARFFVPIIAVMFAVAMAGAAGIQSPFGRRTAVAALMLTTPLLWHNRYWEPSPAFWTALSPSPGDVGNIRIGRWIRDHTHQDSIVAALPMPHG